MTDVNDGHDSAEIFDTVVIGAGQGGLAAGHYLKRAGRDFVVLDAHPRVGDAWRNRWDSLRLFTPNRYDALPGLPLPGPPQAFPGKDAMADYLESYAEHFQLPVRSSVTVERVWQEGGHYALATDHGRINAADVVLATSGTPRVPDFAAELGPSIRQLHAIDYRRPDQLSDGPTLLVGAGNTGGEIALDLAHRSATTSARPATLLSGRDVGEVPGPIPDSVPLPAWRLIWWLVDRVLTVNSMGGRRVRTTLQGKGMPRVRVTRKTLDAAGVRRVARTVGVREGKPLLADGAVLDVANVVWCTGYERDYSWIDLPVLDSAGRPDHRRGIATRVPGFYFLGLPFQRSVTSGLVGGAGADARYIVEHLSANRPSRSVAGQRTR